MQLLVHPDKNKTTAPSIQCKNCILVILLLLCIHIKIITAERICHQCYGINCLRTSYVATQKCLNDFDICVTLFDGQTVQAQGCLEQIPEELRHKCDSNVNLPTHDSEELEECFKCNNNLCNYLPSSSFKCVQCDSDIDPNCHNNTLSLTPTRCNISRTLNEYCFVRVEGKRVIRGCSNTLEEQKSCLSSADCMICQPSELWDCNGSEVSINDNGSDGNDNGSDGENAGDGDTGTDTGITSTRLCHQCSGINCLRTSYEATQKCHNDLDICVTVFDGQTILAQGCFEQLSEELRNKCDEPLEDSEELSECVKCSGNLCNNFGSNSYECVQCDSDIDDNCSSNPLSLLPSRCFISRTPNEYCFIRREGKHVIRGCSNTLEEQKSCLSNVDCTICQPSELIGCNGIEIKDDSGSGDDGNSSGGGTDGGSNGGSGSGSDSGTDGSSDGSTGNNTGNDGSGSGSDGGSEGGTDGSNNGSGGENTGDGGLENGEDNNSGNGSDEGGSNSGSGNGGGTSIINVHIIIFILNIIIVIVTNK